MFKKFKNFIAIFIVATFIMPQSVFAYSKYIVAGGENIGLQINNNGIIVAGFYKIGNIDNSSYLRKGDTIVEAGGKNITSIDEFVNAIKESNGSNLKIVYTRDKKRESTNINLINDNGTIKTGLYIKDTVSGIGTLTYIDPNTRLYGALGHEVFESSTGIMMNVKDGKIYDSNVTSIEKSTRGDPGCKNANVDQNKVFGKIAENTKSGVFGKYEKEIDKSNLYEVGEYKDIKVGNAKIITVINGKDKKEYDINIIKVNNNVNDNKNILFEITDDELLSKTGGIIQGMSGSPIVQDKKIIGAVTNVVVNNPQRGYGILITTMLKEAEN